MTQEKRKTKKTFLSTTERLTYDAQMSAVTTEDPVPSYLSPFTLALLEDTVRFMTYYLFYLF